LLSSYPSHLTLPPIMLQIAHSFPATGLLASWTWYRQSHLRALQSSHFLLGCLFFLQPPS
jgi:hypothetical protein